MRRDVLHGFVFYALVFGKFWFGSGLIAVGLQFDGLICKQELCPGRGSRWWAGSGGDICASFSLAFGLNVDLAENAGGLVRSLARGLVGRCILQVCLDDIRSGSLIRNSDGCRTGGGGRISGATGDFPAPTWVQSIVTTYQNDVDGSE